MGAKLQAEVTAVPAAEIPRRSPLRAISARRVEQSAGIAPLAPQNDTFLLLSPPVKPCRHECQIRTPPGPQVLLKLLAEIIELASELRHLVAEGGDFVLEVRDAAGGCGRRDDRLLTRRLLL
jgi:hypothetical protein